jgi:hypothetical protein
LQDNHQDTNDTPQPTPATGTQPGAVPGPHRPALAPCRKTPIARIKQLLLWLVLLGLLLMALAVVRSLLHPPQWIFSAKAKTGVVELLTPDDRETRWRINGAAICIRGELGASPATVDGARLADSICGSTAWTGYRFRDPELTLILQGAVHVTLELAGDQRLFVSLRQRQSDAATDDRKKGAILSFTDGTPDIVLGKNGSLKVNLIWPGTDLPAPDSYTDRIFPFSGITTIGRDINWTGTSLLIEGDIEVYTYDDSPDKRQLVDTAELMLGDRVRLLDFTRDDLRISPKGFVRHAPGSRYFDVVAFGAADRVRIERYGENGYDFRPGLISQLTRDPLLIGLLSFLVAAIGLLSAISGMLQQKDEE